MRQSEMEAVEILIAEPEIQEVTKQILISFLPSEAAFLFRYLL